MSQVLLSDEPKKNVCHTELRFNLCMPHACALCAHLYAFYVHVCHTHVWLTYMQVLLYDVEHCGLECVLLAQNVISYYRMFFLTIECVLLL